MMNGAYRLAAYDKQYRNIVMALICLAALNGGKIDWRAAERSYIGVAERLALSGDEQAWALKARRRR